MTAKAATSAKKTKTTKPKAAAAKASTKSKAKVAAPTQAKTTEQPKRAVKDDKSKLRSWHLGLGIALLVEATAVVVAGTAKTVELTTQYLSKDALATEAAAGSEVLATATRHLADLPLSWLVAAFLAVFGATFLLLATVWRKHYEAWVDQGSNKVRWLAYGLGLGLMAVTVAMLTGITDAGYLFMIWASLLVLGALVTIVDLAGTVQLRKYLVITALFTAALPVIAIARIVAGSVLYDGRMPVFMYFVYASMLLAAVAFVLACTLRLRHKGKFMDTFYTEKAFMLLGFGTATVLALQIFAGALQP